MEKEEVLVLPKVAREISHEEKCAFLNKFQIRYKHKNKISPEELFIITKEEMIYNVLSFTIEIDKFKDDEDILFDFTDLFNNFRLKFIFDINKITENQIKKIKKIIKQILDQRIDFEEKLVKQLTGQKIISLKDKLTIELLKHTPIEFMCFSITMLDSSIEWEGNFSIVDYDKILNCIDLITILTPDKMNQLENEFDVIQTEEHNFKYNFPIKGNYLRLLIIDPMGLGDVTGYGLKCSFIFKNHQLSYDKLLIDFKEIAKYFCLEIVCDLEDKNKEERKNIDTIIEAIRNTPSTPNIRNSILMSVNCDNKNIFKIYNR